MNFALYAIQSWRTERWWTFYVSSYDLDAEEVFDDLTQQTDQHLRLIKFTVDDFEFLSAYTRDFAVVKDSEAR